MKIISGGLVIHLAVVHVPDSITNWWEFECVHKNLATHMLRKKRGGDERLSYENLKA